MATEALNYIIYFENDSTASAPAEQVWVTDPLDANLDPTTAQLGEIAFGSQVVTNLAALSLGTVSVPIDNSPYVLQITASTDSTPGTLQWTFCTINPLTGQLPADPMAGFLPPGGQAYVTFSVKPKAGTAQGTVLSNTASIKFDKNLPIATNTVSNAIGFEQPDALIGLPGAASYSGGGEYGTGNQIPADQIKKQVIGLSQTAVFYLEAANNGNAIGDTVVTGPASSGGWSIKYYDAPSAGNDITGAVTTGGWTISALTPGAPQQFRVEITPDKTVPPGVTQSVAVTMAAADNASNADAVEAIANIASYQPDLSISAAGDAQALGAGIINNTGVGQTRTLQY